MERCVPSSSGPGAGTVLEIDVQGARQVRETLPDAVRIFVEPPSVEDLGRRLTARASDTPEQIERRLQAARDELAAREEFPHRIVNDDLERATDELVDLAARVCRLMIKPRLDNLLEQVDSHYACVLVAAKRARQINSYYHNLGEGTFDEYPPPMVDTGSKNYLKISLEELAAGKLKYRYR